MPTNLYHWIILLIFRLAIKHLKPQSITILQLSILSTGEILGVSLHLYSYFGSVGIILFILVLLISLLTFQTLCPVSLTCENEHGDLWTDFFLTGVMLFKLTLGWLHQGRMVCGEIGLSVIVVQGMYWWEHPGRAIIV